MNGRTLFLSLAAWSGALLAAQARTITFTDLDADKMAAFETNDPECGWAGGEARPGVFFSGVVGLSQGRGFLIRYPLDRIPKGQRIVNAELVVPVQDCSPPDAPVYVWRLTADWGVGVCPLYRQTRPQRVPWSVLGARGSGVDRAPEPTRIAPLAGNGHDVTVNVTADIELWYSGVAKNEGWLLTHEQPGENTNLLSPLVSGRGRWRLRITYEPP